MHKGARFYRCDFQVHTPRDPQWTGGTRPKTDDERAAWAARLIAACRTRGLDAIAITDHHDLAMIRYVRAAAAAELDAGGGMVPADRRVLVFPGMEVTVSLPCQLLILFDADLQLELLDQLPGTLGYNQAPPDAAQSKQAEKLTHVHPNDVIARLEALSYLQGRFIVLPHVGEKGHQTILRSGFDAHYRDFTGVGGYTDGEMPAPGKGARNILDGIDPAYGRKALAVFQTSDCRIGDFSTLGSHSTWVKWSKPTAEALRQSCLARHSRVSQTQPQLPAIAITRIDVSASKFLGKQNVFLSPQYNALIGGRGTGKSTLLEYARWALCMPTTSSTDEPEAAPEYERRSVSLIEKTLADVKGAVRVTVEVRGVEHIVERRTSSEDKLVLKVGAEDFRPTDEDEVRRLLPVEAYRQKELSSVGGSAADVLKFVLAPVARAVSSVDDDLARAGDIVRASYGRLRVVQRANEEATRLEGERASLLQQQGVFQQQFASLDPADAATIRSADGYAAERTLRDRWRGELTEARQAVETARAAISKMPRDLPATPTLPDDAQVRAMHANLDVFYKALRAAVDAAINTFEGAQVARFREGDAALEASLDAARERFKQARERASAHETAIKQVEDLSKRINEITQRLGALEGDVSGLPAARAAYQAASEQWVSLVRARGQITLDRCMLIESRSKKLIRATVRPAGDLALPLAMLAEIAKGSRLRSDRFNTFEEYLDQQVDPLDAWLRAVDELRGIVGLRSEDATLPHCPVLNAGGFGDKELRALSPKLDAETWLRLRLARPSDAVTFEYRSREGEYIAFGLASAGQRATALMRVLLADEGVPLVIDQPEDDLDNKIIHEIASDIWQAKTRRQLIFASHNANLVVNGDADLVVVFDYTVAGEQTSGAIATEGAIDDDKVRAAIADVMEGGREAFQLRADKYKF